MVSFSNIHKYGAKVMPVDDTCSSAISSKHPALVVHQESHVLSKAKLDGMLLGYMARRLQLTLGQLRALDPPRRGLPPVYHLLERGGQVHRIALYQPGALLKQTPLSFVGFLSARQKPLSPSILEGIHSADRQLVTELADAPGILSYSSLELRNGDWCNLVVLADTSAKVHITGSQTHQHAAYSLAHAYYAWIRLHSGVMPVGLDHMEMHLVKTRYYTFHPGQAKPTIRELAYTWPSEVVSERKALVREDTEASTGFPYRERSEGQEG
jgi:hypothetical protein